MSETQKSPGHELTGALRNELVKVRTELLREHNDKKHAVSGHILWVSGTVFAVLVIGGHAGCDPLFSAAVVLNALCILFCSISLFEPVNSADRSQAAVAKLLRGKANMRSVHLEGKEIHQTNHQGVTVSARRVGDNIDILLHEGRRKFFGVCEVLAYVCFVLVIISLTVFALTR